ncbi:MAG: hypothetical protein ACLQI7_25775 [Streptosporangiaceae bacterium]
MIGLPGVCVATRIGTTRLWAMMQAVLPFGVIVMPPTGELPPNRIGVPGLFVTVLTGWTGLMEASRSPVC